MANITLRLHRQHDMDLIALYQADDYRFAREMKKVLVSYANGEIYEPKALETTDFETAYVPTSVTFHISLNEKKEDEAKAITLLSCMKTGYRNSFAKAVFRSSIPYLPLVAFAKDNGFIMKKDPLGELYRAKKNSVKRKTTVETDMTSNDIELTKSVPEVNDEKTIATKDIVTKNVSAQTVSETNNNNTNNDKTVTTNEADDDELGNLFSQMSGIAHM